MNCYLEHIIYYPENINFYYKHINCYRDHIKCQYFTPVLRRYKHYIADITSHFIVSHHFVAFLHSDVSPTQANRGYVAIADLRAFQRNRHRRHYNPSVRKTETIHERFGEIRRPQSGFLFREYRFK